ncbi:MAG: hypothetical protein KBG09_07310 [Syntrophobacterales bacterium]|nr:hypothetical protein [Syntrophobacterales bacterium]
MLHRDVKKISFRHPRGQYTTDLPGWLAAMEINLPSAAVATGSLITGR